MFYFEKNFGLFMGKLSGNKFHKHYAIQISISLHSEMLLTVANEKEVIGNAFLIAPKQQHKLISQTNQITMLINPLSAIGHQLHLQFGNSKDAILENELSISCIAVLESFEKKVITFEKLCHLISKTLTKYRSTHEQKKRPEEDRISKAIDFLDANFERVVPLEEVAAYCFLSPSRFLHLFKEKTNLNFRRYQLWNRVVKSLPSLQKNSITETAHAFGFSDSSHYTRTFIETFGVIPKFFLPKE
jgi:AraC-like DNA-binding protein